MSNWKHAYGWSGHILVSADDTNANPDDNVVAVQPTVFATILKAFNNCKLDRRIEKPSFARSHRRLCDGG